MFRPSSLMPARGARRTAGLLLLGALVLVAAAPMPGGRVPRLILAVRTPDPTGLVPGLGPAGRFRVGAGRLVLRESDGRRHDFLAAPAAGEPRFVDVADPAVSYDGRTVVFAAVATPGGPWRLYTCDARGHGVRPLLQEGGDRHDIDPAWLPDGRIVFASTRFAQRAERPAYDTTNLFSVFPDGSGLIRLTTDRNGAEEPSVDPRNGRLVYARWWFNRYRPPVVPLDTLTTDPARAMPADPVDLWHAISIRVDGDGMRLAGGWPRIRSETMAYQPVIAKDGTLIGVTSTIGALVPVDGVPPPLVLVAYPGGFARPVTIAEGGTAPLVLDDGRIVFSAPGPAGDRALYLVRKPGDRPALLADSPGFDDLDAAVLAPREPPAVLDTYLPPPRREAPVLTRAPLEDLEWTFRFDCLNVFANGAVDSPFPDAPPITPDLRIRFFAVLDRPGSDTDSVILVREAPLVDGGAVHEHDMPADTPMFEQLVTADGQVLRGFSGPAHVPGFNFARFGSGTKCVGCHVGHSAMEVAKNYSSATWTNVAPSARLTTEGVANPALGTRPLVDRRAKGPIDEVGCRMRGDGTDRVRLTWAFPVEVREVILYAGMKDRGAGTDSRIRLTDITFLDADRAVQAAVIDRDLEPSGTHLSVDGVRIDALDIQFRRVEGTVDHQPGGALSEIEVIGRLVDR